MMTVMWLIMLYHTRMSSDASLEFTLNSSGPHLHFSTAFEMHTAIFNFFIFMLLKGSAESKNWTPKEEF